jgi:hypothetical protein
MFYVSKGFQAAGLVIILAGFFMKFPSLMSPKIFGVGILFFIIGWTIERYLLK